jgi:hypothetical protein
MELQVSRAAVIMTGTVQRLHRIQGQSLYQGDVLIKRIIKGTKKVNQRFVVFVFRCEVAPL